MKDERVYLQHILDTARRLENRMRGLTQEQSTQDDDLQVIAVHLLQIIGEAARLVTQPTRDQMASLPWKQITGMRHRIVHDYFDVNLEIVWETVAQDIPMLAQAVENYLKRTQP